MESQTNTQPIIYGRRVEIDRLNEEETKFIDNICKNIVLANQQKLISFYTTQQNWPVGISIQERLFTTFPEKLKRKGIIFEHHINFEEFQLELCIDENKCCIYVRPPRNHTDNYDGPIEPPAKGSILWRAMEAGKQFNQDRKAGRYEKLDKLLEHYFYTIVGENRRAFQRVITEDYYESDFFFRLDTHRLAPVIQQALNEFGFNDFFYYEHDIEECTILGNQSYCLIWDFRGYERRVWVTRLPPLREPEENDGERPTKRRREEDSDDGSDGSGDSDADSDSDIDID